LFPVQGCTVGRVLASCLVLVLAASCGCISLPWQGAENPPTLTDLSQSYRDPDTGLSFLYPAGSAVIRISAGDMSRYRILLPGLPPDSLSLSLMPGTPYPEELISTPPEAGSGVTVIESGKADYAGSQGIRRTLGFQAGGEEIRRQEVIIRIRNSALVGSLTVPSADYPVYSPVLEGILSSARLDPSRSSRVPIVTITPASPSGPAGLLTVQPLFLRGDVIQPVPLDEDYDQDHALVVLFAGSPGYTLKPVRKYDFYDGWYADGKVFKGDRVVVERDYPWRTDSVDPARIESLPGDPLERLRDMSDLSPYAINYNTTNWQLFSPNEKFIDFRFDPDDLVPDHLEGYETLNDTDREGRVRQVLDARIAGATLSKSLTYTPSASSALEGKMTGIVLEALTFRDRESANAYYQGLFSSGMPRRPGGLDAAYEYAVRDGAASASYTMLLGDTAVISTAFDHGDGGRSLAGEDILETASKTALYTALKTVL
jgi:hypothetical protein